MLRPRETSTRERRSLDGLWRFALDRDGVGRIQEWWTGPLAGAREVPVPASYNDVFADAAIRDYVGEVWYETAVRVPARWDGQRIVLRFDAATHHGTAWVNGVQVAEHAGGYTPFEADVTEAIVLGAENTITVAVDNRLSWQTIPPGRVLETPDGP